MPQDCQPPGVSFRLRLNGEEIDVRLSDPNLTLLDWLRSRCLTGTKEGCAEGDCGACTVLVIDQTPAGQRVFRSLNSCIALLGSLAEKEVWTVEGLARDGLHPVQEAMACGNGTQCGFCTPGFIASLAEGYYRDHLTSDPVEFFAQLDGNLCRCTGYRPIREAALRTCSRAPSTDRLLAELQRDPPQPPSNSPCEDTPFFLPTDLRELWDLQEKYPGAVCVAGGTEVGVHVAKLHRRHPAFIGLQKVREFLQVETTDTHMLLGAGVPLTDLMPVIRTPFPSLYEMCRWFASRPIRNRATLGGNLATASPIGDTAPVLLSLGAELQLVSPNGSRMVPLAEFFTGYRKTILQDKEWIVAIQLPLPPEHGRLAWAHKVSKRREMDISTASAAFCLDFDPDKTIRTARMAFGGVAPTPAMAREAAAFLEGKTLNEETIAEVSRMLGEAFDPITDARGTKEYRRLLPAALWEAFARPETRDAPDVVLPGIMPWNSGTAPPHESAERHVSGAARYVDDEATRADALHVWPVFSSRATGRIRAIDTSKATAVPGVLRVLTAKDIPGENNTGPVRHDEPLLAFDEVQFVGQIIAAVVAETLDACRKAAELVEIDFDEESAPPPIVTLKDAIQANSFHTEFNTIRRGDPEAALASSPHRIQGTFELGGQEHFYLECQAACAEITEDDLLLVHSSTQHPTESQTLIASMLGIERNQIIVHSPRMGGGFGGKETQGAGPACLAALATRLTGQPCRVRYNRDQDFLTTGKRHPFLAGFEAGMDPDGTLRAIKVSLYSNGGWSLDLSQPITDRALFHLDNIYYLPAVQFQGRVAKTNLPSNTAFRGFGGPQGMLVIEEILDRVARHLRLDPHTVRERNLYHGSGETNTTHYGQEIGDNRIPAIWSSLRDRSRYHERKAEIDRSNANSPRFLRGIAQTGVKFGISFTHTPYNQAGALVLLYTDGSLLVNHGGTEMGQGLYSKIQAVASRSMGLPMSLIRVTQTRTDKVPNTSATAASSGSDLNGAAVRDACEQIRSRLLPLAAEMLGIPASDSESPILFENAFVFSPAQPEHRIPFRELVTEAYNRRISLAAFGFYKTPGIHYDREKGRGRPFFYFACGSAVSEVEVDRATGQSRLLRVDILHDVGASLNPAVDRGQIEGGFVQGMGWLTSEELLWNDKGHLMSHGASTYMIPTHLDAPAEFHVELLEDAAQPGTIFGSKAVGEPPLMLAISVREAIRDAVASVRGESSEGISLGSPATCEAIFRALRGMPSPSTEPGRYLA